MAKYYLDPNGVRILVRNFSNSLATKADKSELKSYATKDYVDQKVSNLDFNLPEDLEEKLTTLENAVTGIYHFKGSVDKQEDLGNIANPEIGDVYNITDTGMNVAWTEEGWDEFGSTVDLSDYALYEDIQSITEEELNTILFSGKTGVVTDRSGIDAMLANDEPEVEIVLNKDMALDGAIVIPQGKKVTLNLDGKKLTAKSDELKVVGELVIDGGGEIETTGWGISGVGSDAKITLNSGHISATESPVSIQQGAKFEMNGGELEGFDNCPLMGQGSAGNGGTEMIINGGKLIAHITSVGYTACGIYMPNDGKLIMNGGEIISDGAGIVMRAGEVELNGGSITANGVSGSLGKVGDSKVTVGPYAVVYDEKAGYPGLQTGDFKLTIGKDMVLHGTDGDISVLMPDGKDISEANIVDNR